jgi:hypothetical protein
VITSAVENTATVRRRGEVFYRRRTGWVAQHARVVTFHQDQPLRPRADGKFAPAGAWGAPQLQVHEASGRVEVRAGDVPADSIPDAGEPKPDPVEDQPQEGVVTTRADADLAFLPAPVRRSVRARALQPRYFDAEALRFTRGDGSYWHTVSVLRLDDREAIVVRASRQARSRTWQAEQYLYTFTAGPALPPPTKRRPWLGRS